MSYCGCIGKDYLCPIADVLVRTTGVLLRMPLKKRPIVDAFET